MEFTILVLTDSGCEEACVKDIGRWVKAKPKTHLNVVELKGTLEDAVTLGYHLQTARRVLLQLTEPLESIDEIEGRTPDQELFAQVFPDTLTFKVDGDVLALRVDDISAVIVPQQPLDTAPIEDGEDESGGEDDDGGSYEEEGEDEPDGTDDEPVATTLLPQELVEGVGAWVHHAGRKVKLSSPDILVYTVATPERIYVGIDVVGRSLAKRDWRIMLSRRSLKATIAAATVIYSGAKPNEVVLDPLGDDGTLAIEAALLFTKTSPLSYGRNFAFEKFPAFAGRDWKTWKAQQDARVEAQKVTAYGINMRELKAIRTNAKLAGIEKDIHATRVDMEWVETKMGENTIDRIITQPAASGKSLAPSMAAKMNDELFYQAEFVLKKNKTITLITEKPEELRKAASKYGFTESSRNDVLMGKRRMAIVTYKNNKRKEEREEE